MATDSLTQQISTMRNSLFHEGLVNHSFFGLEKLEDKSNPNFLETIVTVFLGDSAQSLACIEEELQKDVVDLSILDLKLIKLKGGGSTIGAEKFTNTVIAMRQHCQTELKHNWDIESLKASFQELKQDHSNLKQGLQSYIQLRRQASSNFPS